MSTVALLYCSVSSPIAVAEFSPEFDWSGFATLGITYRDHHDLYFHRDYGLNAAEQHITMKTDSLLGVQGNVMLSDHWDAMGQVVLQDQYDSSVENALQWLFIRYRPNNNWAIRVGRLGLDLYMMTEYRNVDYAYPWSRPFTEFYGLTSSISRIDGADVSYFTSLGHFGLEFKLAYGSNDFMLQGADQVVNLSLNGNLAFTASARSDALLLRFAVAQTSLSGNSELGDQVIAGLNQIPAPFWPEASAIADEFVLDNRRVNYYALGAQYDWGQWLLQSELGYTQSSWAFFQSSWSGYVALAYRHQDLTWYGGISHISLTEDRIEVPPPSSLVKYLPETIQTQIDDLYQGTSDALNSAIAEQTGYSLGVRWDFYPMMALKLQWDHFEIGDYGSSLWQRGRPIVDAQQVNLVSLNWNLVF
ncbi:hypothetical protein [Shewanella sp. NIFS-20-20]|uniref:hypothetical protein n=1 Tax=Shewanella sp. NIFS-20-20 TaxID=2853806 RepID=UPI001C43F196|nr:hypothetical protein [Shewanella sp. NIFS-20-20]MBV7314086.1 hypothetical protein [Shewanella sp. NIFS-20-20]